MRGISQLRRGRTLQTRAKKKRLRPRKPSLSSNTMKSEFRQAPRREPSWRQPYLGTDIKVADLVS
jgi:hypothetical protein